MQNNLYLVRNRTPAYVRGFNLSNRISPCADVLRATPGLLRRFLLHVLSRLSYEDVPTGVVYEIDGCTSSYKDGEAFKCSETLKDGGGSGRVKSGFLLHAPKGI